MFQRAASIAAIVLLLTIFSMMAAAEASAWWPGQWCERGASALGFGWCDSDFAPDGSYTHCEFGWLGINNCWRVIP